MARARDGWTVTLHEPTQTLMLLQGIHVPWGHVYLGWTAGTKKDGRALLREISDRRLAELTRRLLDGGR